MSSEMNQLQETADAVEIIRKYPEQFLGGASRATSDRLAALLLRDALCKEASNVWAERHGDWWVVGGNVDWVSSDGIRTEDAFRKLIPLPSAGRNCHRSEVIVAAFASAIMTSVGGERTTVLGGSNLLPPEIEARSGETVARTVAFRLP